MKRWDGVWLAYHSFANDKLPSQIETFPLLAQALVTGNPHDYAPTAYTQYPLVKLVGG